jgi:transcriptional regulator with XRE-family HTH domain
MGMLKVSESQQFADRLRGALESAGVRASPTLVANAFNLRYRGRSITPHTARNWLLGKVMPTQDKLRVLSDWLQVSPDELRFGRAPGKTYVFEMNNGPVEMAWPTVKWLIGTYRCPTNSAKPFEILCQPS